METRMRRRGDDGAFCKLRDPVLHTGALRKLSSTRRDLNRHGLKALLRDSTSTPIEFNVRMSNVVYGRLEYRVVNRL